MKLNVNKGFCFEFRLGMVVSQLMFGSPSTPNSTTDAVKEVAIMLVRRH